MSLIETVLLSLLAAAMAVAVTVWLGAVVSAIVVGSGVPPIGLGDALRSIPSLFREPGDPSAAWPTDAVGVIAGPVIYWT
ncbi:MAG: type IV secretory system conjugative DNA transfer family protein, partial [Ilumatobacter sp.]